MARVTIELYGIARRRAGREAITLDAATLRDALRALAREVPPLSGEILVDGAAAPHWRVSLDGARFLEDGDEALPEGARLLLLSSLAGG